MKRSGLPADTVPPLPQFGAAELQRLGRHLRARRVAAGLSLRALSVRAGVGVASISALERSRSSPGFATVLRVVQALGLSIDAAIEAARAGPGRVIVSRAAQAPKDGAQMLSRGLEAAALEARIVALAPGALVPVPADLATAPTLCLVLEGEIIASRSDARRVRLAAGDAYHAQGGEMSSWVNGSAAPGRLLCVAQRGARA